MYVCTCKYVEGVGLQECGNHPAPSQMIGYGNTNCTGHNVYTPGCYYCNKYSKNLTSETIFQHDLLVKYNALQESVDKLENQVDELISYIRELTELGH